MHACRLVRQENTNEHGSFHSIFDLLRTFSPPPPCGVHLLLRCCLLLCSPQALTLTTTLGKRQTRTSLCFTPPTSTPE